MEARAIARVVVAFAALWLARLPAARATQRFGPIQISGNLQSQNLIRHPDRSTYSLVQQRNVAHLRFDWDILQHGVLLNKYNIPFIQHAHLFLLYRGVYDSIYDITPGFRERVDFRGTDLVRQARTVGVNPKRLTIAALPHSARAALRFENVLREAYIDLKFRNLPLSLRLGRQQVVWGETDNFRMLDRANPLDFTWHMFQEIPTPSFGWDEIRRPLWMVKGLWEIGRTGPLSDGFIEFYWDLGDWEPAKIAFLPRPWGLRILDPLTNPIDGAFIGGVCGASRFKEKIRKGPPVSVCKRLMAGTRLFKQGDWSRNPMDNSQFGIRYHGTTPQGIEFTINYFYQRWAGDDGTDYAMLKGIVDQNPNSGSDPSDVRAARLISNGIFPAKAYHPYVHTIGLSANYSDETYTQTVFRLETVYDFGVPFFDRAIRTQAAPLLPGIRRKNMWKGMIGFDRPTWIRFLNKRTTFFITGQWFWHYLVDNPDCSDFEKGKPGASCLTGNQDLPSSLRGEQFSFRDKVRDWESIVTLAMFTFYRGGSIVPVVGYILDPVNHYESEAFWSLDYFLTNDLILNIAQRYFINPTGISPNFEPWFLAGGNRGRSETGIRLTYQF